MRIEIQQRLLNLPHGILLNKLRSGQFKIQGILRRLQLPIRQVLHRQQIVVYRRQGDFLPLVGTLLAIRISVRIEVGIVVLSECRVVKRQYFAFKLWSFHSLSFLRAD